VGLGTYDSWIDDLVALCRSHHEGYNELRRERFNPRYVGAPPAIVHLRYLAVALRVADVLEFDPERTPDVILRHRNISSASRIYWWKDQAMSMKLEGPRIVISARPRTAQIHKAIETTVRDINAELSLSRRLADDTRFQTCPGLAADLPHRWELLPATHHDIQPRDDSYVYIDGAFRPDTQKLLQLLSGVELYGNELVAVRELLQNAFDAVREKIAYERLNSPNPADPSLEDKLGELNRVDLRLELSDDGAWLICSDTGVGMTRALIEDHLLVSGVSSRHDVLELERRCKRAGFTLGRTGQFGIGVLSYFMLADRVVIRTRRTQEPGDADNEGWNFDTEGVGSFGELRRDSSIARSTEVRLHLRQESIGLSLPDWYSKLTHYVRRELLRVPCCFSLKSTIGGEEPLNIKPGFAYDNEQLADMVAQQPGRHYASTPEIPSEILPLKKQEEREAEKRHWLNVRSEIRQCLNWASIQGDLPDKLGSFRVHLPYFELPGGNALVFLRSRQEKGHLYLEPLGEGYRYRPRGEAIFSWKGMRVMRGPTDPRGLPSRRFHWQPPNTSFIEVDWSSGEAGRIGVNRHDIELSEKGRRALQSLTEQSVEMCRNFLAKNRGSSYALLNSRVTETRLGEGIKAKWLVVRGKSKVTKALWEELKPPLMSALSLMFSFREGTRAKWDSKSVSIVRCLGDENENDAYDGWAWHGQNLPPDRICARRGAKFTYYPFGLTPLWTARPGGSRPTHPAGLISQFPPQWNRLCGVQFENYSEPDNEAVIWNPENIVVSSVTAEAWAWCRKNFRKTLDPLPLKGSLLIEKSRVASWILMCLAGGQSDIWDGLKERDQSFLPTLLDVVFGIKPDPGGPARLEIAEWVEEANESSRLRILTPHGWKAYRIGKETLKIEEYLPDPGPNWTVTLDDTRGQEWTARFAGRTRVSAIPSVKKSWWQI